MKKHLLELGCGNGDQAKLWASLGFKVDAVDISEQNIEGVNFIRADVRNFKIKKGKYSVIVINFLLQALDKSDARKLLINIQYSIKKGGALLYQGLSDKDLCYKEGMGYISAEEMKELFKDYDIVELFKYSKEDAPHPGYDMVHNHEILKASIKF